MTGTFRANNPYNNFLLLIYGLLIKLPMFLRPVAPQPQPIDGFLYKEFIQFLQPVGKGLPVIYPLITFGLLFTQAIWFNKLLIDQRIMQRPNYLTGMSYLLITSMFPEWNLLSSPLIVNSLLIWVWAKMSTLSTDHAPKAALFNIGIAIGICTFFYFPSLAFVALIIFGLALTRAFRLAEWVIALLGIITPYYFLLAYVFLTDKWQHYKFPSFAVVNPVFNQSKWAMAGIILVIASAMVGVFYIQQNFRRQLIQARKSWNLVFLYLIIAFFVPFVNATHTFEYWILCAVPLSALIAATFLYPSRTLFPMILHWVMVAMVIMISYFL